MGMIREWKLGLFAAAIVLGEGPGMAQSPLRFVTPERTDGEGLLLKVETVVGTRYRVENSSDLAKWNLWQEFVAQDSVTPIAISDSSEREWEFFRATEVVDVNQAALDENRAKWAAIAWQDYRLRIDVSEFIPDEVSRGIVTVEGGMVTDVELPLTEGEFFGFRFNYPLSVEGLFDRLQNALDQDPAQFRVSYHPEFGFPVEAFIDYDERIADEENGFRVTLLGPSRVEGALAFELAEDPFVIQSTELVGNSLSVEVEYGGGCRGHLFALLDLMPGVFAESEPPRPLISLHHDHHDDLCKALVRENRSFDLSPLAVSATRIYGSPIPMILEFGSPQVTVLYTPAGTSEFLTGRATSQAWQGGVQGSGSGIDYRFKLTAVTDGIPEINEVWIGQRMFVPTVQLPNGKTNATVKIGDTIDVLCHFRREPVFEGVPFESEIVDWRDVPPIVDGPEYEGAALFRYETSEGVQAFTFPEIESLPDLFFP